MTAAGAAQTLAPWTIERSPSVTGIVRRAGGPCATASYTRLGMVEGRPPGGRHHHHGEARPGRDRHLRALTKDVKAVDRPEVEGDAWLVGTTVVATGPSLEVRKSHLGKKITGRVTNDAGFAQAQAITEATAKVGYRPKLKAKVSPRSISMVLKAKPLKAKKVNATVVVYEKVGTKANGEAKLKKLGKGKVKKGTGAVRLTKALGKGKHKLVFRIKGKGKVGSGDLVQKVRIKR